MSGQMSGQIPNRAGSQLPGLPQQNESSPPSQIQNLGAHLNTSNMEPDIMRARENMQVEIYEYITQQQSSPHDLQPKRVIDLVRCLDDDYTNLDTLESRLHGLIKGLLWRYLAYHLSVSLSRLSATSPPSCHNKEIPFDNAWNPLYC
ncbi:hypothetical protein PVL29_002404 [Vitis rotundifolia]|uniref:Uncharacterized protein n=1 Tax=Vitis rotundifolia TaxID=103349 RepID=A0AA39E522_VITRO|nr:hypothetical protein PVL29_002404 [Vitis rotundifolia]